MAPKADITYPNGTKAVVDGTVEDIAQILEFSSKMSPGKPGRQAAPAREQAPVAASADGDGDEPDVAAIVSIIKDCGEAEAIEAKVLDQKDVLNRVLLCLWTVHKYFNPNVGLTSGDIEKITDQLGVKVGISNASTILSGRAKAFVSGDSVRKKGGAVHYRLNRRGVQAFEDLIKA